MKNDFKAVINFQDYLSGIDWVIFILVLGITFLSVIYGQYIKKKQKHNADESLVELLLMGRKLTLPLFIATLVATWYGGIFGVTRIAFEKGIFNFVTQGFFWYVTYLLFAFFILKKITHFNALTLPDLVGKMFGPRSLKLSAIFNFFNVVPIVYVISLGLFFKLFWGGSLLPNMLIGVFIVLLYATFGGFRSIVFSDLVQFYVMCSGVLVIVIFSIINFGGLDYLVNNLPPNYFSITGDESWATTMVWGFIALSTLVNPAFYQRCFAAKSQTIAKKGIIISTFIWFVFDICTTLGAMYAKATIPNAPSDIAYFTYALQLVPPGFRGFFLAGVLATILSTLDSYLFIAGTTLTYDILGKKFRNKIWIHHAGIVLVACIAIIMAQIFEGNIKTVWKTLGSYYSSCLLLPILAGQFFPKRISDNQFVVSCLIGVIGTTWWILTPRSGFFANIDELYIGMLCTLTGLLFPYHIFKK